jgi:thiamine pyrophosphokinase
MPPEATRPPHALILADGAVPTRATLDDAWPGWADDVRLVVAADGGVRHAPALGFRVDRWVGDGDSTSTAELASLEADGVAIERSAVDKDESDTELALVAALDDGAARVSIVGALGGPRIDHALANVALLLHARLGDRPAVLYDEHGARLSLVVGPDHRGLPGRRELAGRVGDLVSLLPLGESAHHVRTEGLRYPLHDEPLVIGRVRGLSNVRLVPVARVSVGTGRLLVIETPARLDS